MKCLICSKKPIEIWKCDNQGSKLEEGWCKECKEERFEDIATRIIDMASKRMMRRNPRSKSANNHDAKDTLQPWKRPSMKSGRVEANKDYMEVYGVEQIRQYDSEQADFYRKKGYRETSRTVIKHDEGGEPQKVNDTSTRN